MAYLDLRASFAAGAAAAPSPIEPSGFARREWEVIILARRDGLSSLWEPGRLTRLVAWLFGGTTRRKLADSRLEALRRLAVLAWHHGSVVPESAISAFQEAGFSADQLQLLLSVVASERAGGPQWWRRTVQPASSSVGTVQISTH